MPLKFLSLSTRRKTLILRMGFILNVTWIALRVCSFSKVKGYLERIELGKGNYTTAELKWAAEAFWRLGWTQTCLIRSIASYLLLCESGQATCLVIGVKKVDSPMIEAHAWIENTLGEVLLEELTSLESYTIIATIGEPRAEVQKICSNS